MQKLQKLGKNGNSSLSDGVNRKWDSNTPCLLRRVNIETMMSNIIVDYRTPSVNSPDI